MLIYVDNSQLVFALILIHCTVSSWDFISWSLAVKTGSLLRPLFVSPENGFISWTSLNVLELFLS